MAGWGCPYEVDGRCRRLHTECDPGRKGCVLHGRGVFPNKPEKNATEEEIERTARRLGKRYRRRDR